MIVYRLVFEPLVFCCSAMSKSENSSVKQSARALGAEVVSNWSEHCSHLIMTGITVTVKVSVHQTHTHTHTHTHTVHVIYTMY